MEREYIKIKKPSPLPSYTHHLKELNDGEWKNWIFYHLLKFYRFHDSKDLLCKIENERKKANPRPEREIAKYIRLWLRNDIEFDSHFQASGEKTNDEIVEGNYDITITNTYWRNKDFHFECKNLDGSKDLTNKYVYYNTYKKDAESKNKFDGGVIRYFNGKYAQKMNFGGMIGFVLKCDVITIKKEIIDRLNVKFHTSPEGDLLKVLDNSIEENDFTFDSYHRRFDSEFMLHHLLLNFQ